MESNHPQSGQPEKRDRTNRFMSRIFRVVGWFNLMDIADTELSESDAERRPDSARDSLVRQSVIKSDGESELHPVPLVVRPVVFDRDPLGPNVSPADKADIIALDFPLTGQDFDRAVQDSRASCGTLNHPLLKDMK